MLEKDPRSNYKASRGLRVLAFSLVAAVILTSLLIVIVRFVWDKFLRYPFNGNPYQAQPLIILLAMGLIAAMLAKMLWDMAEMRVAPARRRK